MWKEFKAVFILVGTNLNRRDVSDASLSQLYLLELLNSADEVGTGSEDLHGSGACANAVNLQSVRNCNTEVTV